MTQGYKAAKTYFAPRSLGALAGFIIFFQLMGGIMAYLTAQGVEGWYQMLEKSPLNPPDWAFGAAWTALYVLLAVTAWLVWHKKTDDPAQNRNRAIALAVFTGHMGLNWAWTPVFFTFHWLLPAFLLILALIVTALWLARLIYKAQGPAAWLMLPYIGWLTFASHLAYYIWRHNA